MCTWMSSCSVARLLKRLEICVAMLATMHAYGIERYVSVSNATPVAPYTNWTTAATTIQAAVDAAVDGDSLWVTNGVYAPITCYKTITIRSVNGATATVIDGGDTQRCATFSSTSTVLEGFTLQNGRSVSGGGAYKGTLNKCILKGNISFGSGFSGGGGGAADSTLNNCLLTANKAMLGYGGATIHGTLINCTLTMNLIGVEIGVGGACAGALTNCIVYGNSGYNCSGYSLIGSEYPIHVPIFLSHCCFTPNPGDSPAPSNIAFDPLFVGTNDFRLQPGSRCINFGTNLLGMSVGDLAGNPRIDNGTVDIGAYEFMHENFFLPDALDCAPLTWTTGGNAIWFPQTIVSSDGIDAAQGGPFPDNALTWLQAEVSTAGTLSFQWRVSCQPQYDSLAFYVDGEPYELISGETEWQPRSVFMGPGAHTNLWVYTKGKSGSAGADCGWVDQVTWTPGVPGAVWTLNTVSANGYGGPTPALGEQLFTNSAMVSASVISPWVLVPENEARACSGWTRTNILPLSGTGTNTVFLMTWDATLTWLWRTQYWLKADTLGAGTIDKVSSWCELGTNVTITATPDSGWRFDHWSGDLAGATITNNRITVAMNSMRHVTAHFVLLDLAEALDTTNLLWTTGGDAPWSGQIAVTWDGIDAARSGVIGNLGMTWMETQVTEPGTLSFQWRCSSEAQYDFSYFLVDGVVRSWLTGADTGWGAMEVELGEGVHTLCWEYWKDESGASGTDACWVDSFVWTPALIHGFDVWSGLHGLTGERSLLFAQDRDSDGVANGIEYAFGTNWSPGQVLMDIKFIDDIPVVEIPKQDSSTVSYAEVLLRGCTNLPCTSGSWTLPVLPATNMIGKPGNRDWFVPEGQPPRAFFRIDAVLRE